jgi:subtilase family serine protease
MKQWLTVVFAAVLAISGAGVSYAAPMRIERSGNTYHRAVCGHIAPAGSAVCHAHVVTDARGVILPGKKATADLLTAPAGYGPSSLRSAYKVSASGSSSTTIAIVDAYGYPGAEHDLGIYRSQFGLPACTTANGCFRKINENGSTYYPYADTGWDQEQALDLDMVSAMCPNCHILLVQASSASYGDLATAVNTAARFGAHAISNSYGGGEYGSQYYESAYNHSGIAITASSGDEGYGVEFPASSPHVTATGGTSLRHASNTRGWAETVWSGAGSGCSSYYAKPVWQKDALCARRTVADVSAVADPNTGVAVYGPTGYYGSGWMVFGGTSVAAPLVAGVYGANGGSVSYGSNPYGHVTALFDVTSGSNGYCGGAYLCTGTTGYDGPSGLGTPDGTPAF